MINLEWVQHRSGIHQMFPASTDSKDAEGNLLVTAYAVHRPDGNWSLMLVNRGRKQPHSIRVSFENQKENTRGPSPASSPKVVFGSDQYVWINDGPTAAPTQSPSAAVTIDANSQTIYMLSRSISRAKR